jgi:uncharacterized protein (DUF433 family)
MNSDMTDPADIDWSDCPQVQRTPGRISGAWAMVSAPRMSVAGLIENFNAGHSIEEVAAMFDGLDVDDVRAIIQYYLRAKRFAVTADDVRRRFGDERLTSDDVLSALATAESAPAMQVDANTSDEELDRFLFNQD